MGGFDVVNKSLESVLSPLRDALTFLTGGLNLLGQAVAPFVEALAPGSIQQFNYWLNNLNATIGQAFLPVIEIFTDAFQQLSAELGPVMRELAPVFASLAQYVAGFLVPVLGLLAAVVEVLVPWFQLMADVLLLTTDIFKPLIAIVKVLVELFKSFGIFSAVIGVFQSMISVLKTVIQQIILLGAAIAHAVGINIQPVIDALKPKNAEINAAPQNAAIKSFDQIRADVTNAAFVAGGTTGKKTQDEWSEELVKQLQEIKDKNKSIGTVFQEGLESIKIAIQTNWDKIVTEFKDIPNKIKVALNLP